MEERRIIRIAQDKWPTGKRSVGRLKDEGRQFDHSCRWTNKEEVGDKRYADG